MKANEFIKKHGLNEAKYVLGRDRIVADVNLADLKRIVESHKLVEIHGFEKSKEIVANAPSDEHFYSWVLGSSGVKDKTVHIGTLREAIADVESCQ